MLTEPGTTAPTAPSGSESTGRVSEAALSKAEAAIRKLAREYPFHASRDLATMAQARRMMGRQTGAEACFGEVARIAHDISGQGAVFGFPLLSRLARSLCLGLRTLGPRDGAILAIIDCHLAGMRVLLDQDITGAEDRDALAVAAGLELLVRTQTRGRRPPPLGCEATGPVARMDGAGPSGTE